MNEQKTCPLLFAGAVNEIELECRPNLCAWAYEGRCALVSIAQSLDSMDRGDITAEMEAIP